MPKKTELKDGKKKKIQPYLSPPLYESFKDYVAKLSLTESGVAEEAIARYLEDRYDSETILKRLSAIERQNIRHERDLKILLEAFTLFLKIWYSHTPEIAEENKATAKERGALRFEGFLDALSKIISGSDRSLIDDLVRDNVIAGSKSDT